MLGTVLQLVSIGLTASLIVFLYIFKRSIPDFQQIFDNLGGDISNTFKEIVSNPTVKASMTQLGKKSGEARASTALKNRVAEKAIGSNILLKKAMEYLDISPLEGLELMGDPTVGPVIRSLMASFVKGGQGLLGNIDNLGGSSQTPSSRNNGGQVPNMS